MLASFPHLQVLAHHPCVLTLRDTDSVAQLSARLRGARRVMVVGNGGIALELVGALRGVQVGWVGTFFLLLDLFVSGGNIIRPLCLLSGEKP
jgi:hypothetical protein